MPRLSRYFDNLIEILRTESTTQNIRTLLRRHKTDGRGGVKLSGPNKGVLLENLRDGVVRGLIPQEQAFDLAQESEENGYQHVFYFRPTTDAINLRDADPAAVADRLFGVGQLGNMNFPKFLELPKTYTWTDFRPIREDSWLAKICGREMVKEKKNEKTTDGTTIKQFELMPKRTNLIAMRHSDGILELRVPRMKSSDLVSKMLDTLQKSLEPAIGIPDYEPWDLAPIRKQLALQPEELKAFYTITDISADDANGVAWNLTPKHGDRDVLEGATVKSSITTVLDEGGKCQVLDIIWHHAPGFEDAEGGFRTIIGSARSNAWMNEVIITKTCSSRTMAYVVDQLRRFDS